MNNANKIIIIQTAFLGDVILATPLIKAVRELFPKAQIDFLVFNSNKKILEYNPKLNNLLLFDKKKNKFKNFLRILKEVKRTKYDVAILPHSSLTSTLFSYLARIKKRVGFDRKISKYLLTDRIKFRKDCLRIEKNLDLLSIFPKKNFDLQTELFFSQNNLDEADDFFSKLDKNKKSIIITPGSFWETKKWLKEYFVELIDKLGNYNVILDGAPFEEEYCEGIIDKTNSSSISNICSSRFMTSVAIMKKCDLAICNDSGAMHMANAVQTDVFAFFGPTSTNSGYCPFRKNDFIFEVNIACRPCGKHGHNKCPQGHHKCMKEIYPELVYDKIKEMV